MKLCKDCKHRKFTFSGWRCRIGEHIPEEKVMSPVTGKITVEHEQFSGLPRCEYMRREAHHFVLHQCGPEGVMWEAK